MMRHQSSRRVRVSCLFLFTLALVTLLSLPALPVDAALPSCVCNNGLVLSDSESCVCQCFRDYLLPNCLYTASQTAAVTVMWYGPASASTDSTTRGCAQWPDWYDDAALAELWSSTFATYADDDDSSSSSSLVRVVDSRCVASAVSVPSSSSSSSDAEQLVAVMLSRLELPGWAAQQLALQVAHNTTSALTPSAFTGAWVADVRTDIAGPVPPPLYVDEWFRINVMTNTSSTAGRYWFLSLQEFGWLVGALILALVLSLTEHAWLFNTEANVGGGLHRATLATAPGAATMGTRAAGGTQRLARTTPQAQAQAQQQQQQQQHAPSQERAARPRPTNLAVPAHAASRQLFSVSPARPDGGAGAAQEEPSLGRGGLRRRQNKPTGSEPGASSKYPNPLTARRTPTGGLTPEL